MKQIKVIVILLVFFSTKLFTQEIPNYFKVGDYLELFNNDSMKIYYNCLGGIVEKNCAEFFRVGKTDSIFTNFNGAIVDYYIIGEVAFKGSMQNNELEGLGTYYYPNGIIKETGIYSNGIRIGEWKYYYDNGNIEKTLNFIDGSPLVLNSFTKRGKLKIEDGDGTYNGFFIYNNNCNPYKIIGKVFNGKMNGKWSLYAPYTRQLIGYEYYENGKFIKGTSLNYEYSDNRLILIQGFVPNENFFIFENGYVCSGGGVNFVEYKNEWIYDKFYPELADELSSLKENHIKNQWLLVNISINNDDSINQINIFSSRNDSVIKQSLKNYFLKNSNYWKTAIINSMKVQTDILFTIIINGDDIVIPAKILHDNQIKWLKGEK